MEGEEKRQRCSGWGQEGNRTRGGERQRRIARKTMPHFMLIQAGSTSSGRERRRGTREKKDRKKSELREKETKDTFLLGGTRGGKPGGGEGNYETDREG